MKKSMADAIPKRVLEVLKADPFMTECCICRDVPQWHHHIIYGRKAINEAWAIAPLCAEHHQQVNRRPMRRLIDWVVLNRATDEELVKYSKVMDYKNRRQWLNGVFGQFSPRNLRNLYTSGEYESAI